MRTFLRASALLLCAVLFLPDSAVANRAMESGSGAVSGERLPTTSRAMDLIQSMSSRSLAIEFPAGIHEESAALRRRLRDAGLCGSADRSAKLHRSERTTLWSVAVLPGLPPAAGTGPRDAALSPEDTIYNDTITAVFNLLHKAIANEIYHQDMGALRSKEDYRWRLQAAFSLILGLALALVPAFGRESAAARRIRDWIMFFLSVVLSLWGAVILMTDTGTAATEHRVLKVQWSSVKAELDTIRSHLLEMKSGQPVTQLTLAQVDAIRRREGALIASETDSIDRDLYDRAWGDANEILYGKDVRTEQQVKDALKKAEDAGTIPYRKPKPKSA